MEPHVTGSRVVRGQPDGGAVARVAPEAREIAGADRSWRLEPAEPPRPLLRPAPRSSMFFPLAFVVAVLPGLYALNWWDLVPPGPWWGLRGLAVLDGLWFDQVPMNGVGVGAEERAYRAVAMQPPLYAWLEAVGLRVASYHNPLASVLPSYAAGALVVILVYFHGRLWWGPGLGLLGAVLTGFNRDLLLQMQHASPVTLGLAGFLGSLLGYGQWLRAADTRRSLAWAAFGGLGLGVSLLSVGWFGLACLPVVLLHRLALGPDSGRRRWTRWWWRAGLGHPLWRVGGLALAFGAILAAPWYVSMYRRYGAEFLAALAEPPGPGSPPAGLFLTLLSLTPATLPLGLFGVVRAVYRALVAETDDARTIGGSFWVVWLAVAALAPALGGPGPRAVWDLALLVPLNLLGAAVMVELASRVLAARSLVLLAPATACTVAWWLSAEVRQAVGQMLEGRRPGASTLLGLHLGLDLIVVLAIATRALDRWARGHDDRRRLVLGGFLASVLAINATAGLREVRFRHAETTELIELRTAILRRQHQKPFTMVAVVSREPGAPRPTLASGPAPPPGGRLRFMLRSALPYLTQLDLRHVEELLELPSPQRLVVLVGGEPRLPYSVQSQLGLEVLPCNRATGIRAFATTFVPPRRARR